MAGPGATVLLTFRVAPQPDEIIAVTARLTTQVRINFPPPLTERTKKHGRCRVLASADSVGPRRRMSRLVVQDESTTAGRAERGIPLHCGAAREKHHGDD